VDPVTLDLSTVTVSRDPCGRWYVSLAIDVTEPEPLPAADRPVGVDLGIVLEDLAVKNMIRNRRLARAIADCGWGTFRAMLEYKAARYGRHLIVIDRWYPSSKACSACGHLLTELSLSTRTWRCPSCGTRHDRDINAAKNILAAGLAVAGGDPGHACGADVRHSGSSRVQSAVKQEPRPARTGIPVSRGGE
jgi:putative transposase